tara:strand:- start:12049 stop:12360 length:312 start_codon:yes stop_codon:yes gene_type:complete
MKIVLASLIIFSSLVSHYANAEFAIPKALTSNCSTEAVYQELKKENIECYLEVLNKRQEYIVFRMLISEYGESMFSKDSIARMQHEMALIDGYHEKLMNHMRD